MFAGGMCTGLQFVGGEKCDPDNGKRFSLQILAHCGSPEVVFSDWVRC
jgi:hypothetical protein